MCVDAYRGLYWLLSLSLLNYNVLAFKLIIWYNAFNVYIHVFTLYLNIKKYLHVITSVSNFSITLLTHPIHINSPLTC